MHARNRKALRAGNKVFQSRLDVYNMLNSATITARNNTLGPNYEYVNGIQRGAIIKLGLNVDF